MLTPWWRWSHRKIVECSSKGHKAVINVRVDQFAMKRGYAKSGAVRRSPVSGDRGGRGLGSDCVFQVLMAKGKEVVAVAQTTGVSITASKRTALVEMQPTFVDDGYYERLRLDIDHWVPRVPNGTKSFPTLLGFANATTILKTYKGIKLKRSRTREADSAVARRVSGSLRIPLSL